MKPLKYFTLLFFALAAIGAILPSAYQALNTWKILPDDYRYGDLYRLSNLPQFKEIPTKCPHPIFTQKQNIALYTIGDSFLEKERIDSLDFAVEKYHYIKREAKEQIVLDTTLENVLLIECVERHAREYFTKEITDYEVVKTIQPQTEILISEKKSIISILFKTNSDIETYFGLGQIEQRFENVFFNFNILLFFKELKASLVYSLFNRTTGNATVSENGQHLFYHLDTDTTKTLNASFSYLSDHEVGAMVLNINKSVEKYKKSGFKKVYLCIIPNKASILEPRRGKYNELISRVQTNKNLKASCVDIYSVYKNRFQNVYALSDSHWNCEGRRLWLELVNNEINKKP